MKRREVNVFNIAFLDLLSGALGAVIILYVAVPKTHVEMEPITPPTPVTLHQSEVDAIKLPLIEKIEQLEKIVATRDKELSEIKEVVAQVEEEEIEEAQESSEETSERQLGEFAAGFTFKGKNLVFIIDVSGSMVLEDRMGQVRAGLKMLLTSLTEDYSIDIVFYPDGSRGLYRALWGHTQTMNRRNREEAFAFLNALFPFGSTPTRDVLRFVIGRYRHVTDIILLSDGAPTLPNSSQMDNIEDLLREIRTINRNNIQINTIGVGSDMVARQRTIKYQFLNDLAEQNEGFFHPF